MPQLITTWVQRLKRHKVLVRNFGYLSAMQAFTMLVPLIVLPYLIAVLGAETYGLVVFAQAVVFYFATLISYGFNVSATKEISIHRDDKDKLSEIVSSVLIVKGGLFLLVLCLMPIVLWLLPQASGHETLFYLTLYLCVFEWLFPVWYFQGIERMGYIALINLVSRSVFLVLIFVLVNTQEDYFLVPLVQGTGALMAGAISLWLVFAKEQVHFKWQSYKTIKNHTKLAMPFFISQMAATLKDKSNLLFIGMFIGTVEVAYYDLASKIVLVIRRVFITMMNVVFPGIAKNKNPDQTKIAIKIIFGTSLLAYGALLIVGEGLIKAFGEQMLPAASLLYLYGLWLPVAGGSALLGSLVLIPHGHSKEFSQNMMMSTVLYFVLVGLVFFTDSALGLMNIYSLTACLLLSIVIEGIHRIYVCRKYDLMKYVV